MSAHDQEREALGVLAAPAVGDLHRHRECDRQTWADGCADPGDHAGAAVDDHPDRRLEKAIAERVILGILSLDLIAIGQ